MWKSKFVSKTRKKYGNIAMTYAIILGLFFLIIGKKDICRGIVLGSIFSVFNFALVSQSLYSKIKTTKGKKILVGIIKIMIRYAVMSFPLFIAIKYDNFDVFGVMTGLFSIQVAILFDYLPKAFLKS